MQQYEDAGFAKQCRKARRLLGLSQKELAEKFEPPIALDTVSRWERGLTLPDPHNVQQICTILKKTPTELGLIPSHEEETVLWNIPARNPRFTGREKLLEKIYRGFNPPKPELLFNIQALYNLNGMGKTQICIQYVHTYYHQYQVVLWIDAATEENIRIQLLKLTEHLQLPEKDAQDQNLVLTAVKRWLMSQRSWLLVLDNVTDARLVQDFLPEKGKTNGHVLLTTLLPSLKEIARRILVDKMSQDEARELLFSRIPITDGSVKETERQAAQQIITTLDGLPLAIEQVSAYIDLTHCSFSQYLQLYQRRHKELLGEGVPADYPKTVATTWSLSFKRVEEANPAAANLLRLCSFLSPDGIPEEIITEGVFGFEGGQTEAMDKQLQFNRAVTAVLQYSLLQKDSEKETLHMHRLVQTVLRDNMDRAEQQHWAERAVVAANTVFPDVEFRNWQRCLRYLPQVQICAELIGQYDIPFIAATRLLEQAGRYLTEIAQYDQAEQFLTQALTLQEEHVQNADYPGRASILTCLAKLRYKQAKYTQAELLYMEAKAIWEQMRAGEDLHAAENLNGLALVYYNQGRYQKAEEFYLKALELWKKTVNYKHPGAAMTINNLAWLYYNQGRYQQAKDYYRQALELWEQIQGSESPDAATSYNGLALLHRSLGNYPQAEQYFTKALKLREGALGPKHPDVATTLNDMAWFCRTLGKYEQAQENYERADSIQSQTFGEQHPHVVTRRNDLAVLHMELGKYETAEHDLLDVYKFRLQTVGPKHPRVATSCHNLGWVYYNMGLYSQGENYHRQAFEIRELALGKEHPHTARSWNALGAIAHALGNYPRAEQCYAHALEICEKAVGRGSPLYATFLNNQALLYVDQGKYQAADKNYRQALSIRKKLREEEHPRMAQLQHNIAAMYVMQGRYIPHMRQTRYQEAERYYVKALTIRRTVFKEDHPETAQSLHSLGELYVLQERGKEAYSYLSQARRIREKMLRPEHPAIAESLDGLAAHYHAQGNCEQAESLYQKALDMREKALGPEHPEVAESLQHLATLYFELEQPFRAEQHFIRALEIKQATLDLCHPSIADSFDKLGALYQHMGQYEKANYCFLNLRNGQQSIYEREAAS